MKNVIITFTLLLVTCFGYGQIKVFNDGKVTVGETSTTAAAEIHIAKAMNPKFRIGETGDLSDYFEIVDQGIGRCAFNKWGASGQNVTIDYNPRPAESTRTSNFRFFRYTDASNSLFTIFEGSNTASINTIFASKGDSYFNAIHGDVAIGVNSPLANYKLHVEGTAYKTSGGDLWAIPSDKRLKKNIKKYSGGLDIVNNLEPVEYEYNGKCGTTDGDYQIGVLAQDLKEVAPFMINEVTHQVVDINEWGEKTVLSEEDILTINASSLKWILVNAVKQQQVIIDDQKKEIENIQAQLAYLQEQMGKILEQSSSSIDLSDNNATYLGQNTPNPFNEFTVIEYKIPTNAQNARIEFFNMEGKALKSYTIDNLGEGQIDVNSTDLPNGVYNYRLVVDNMVVDSKKMMKNR